jgi:hypothetical protein
MMAGVMDENPYASPRVVDEQLAVPAEASAQSYRLYSPVHVAWATFLGSPIAGCILMAINYWRLGEPKSGRLAIVYGVVASSCLCALGFFLPERFPNSILPIAFTWGMYGIAKSLQGDSMNRHINNGGLKASGWRATGVGLLCLVGILVLLFAVFVVLAVVNPDSLSE